MTIKAFSRREALEAFAAASISITGVGALSSACPSFADETSSDNIKVVSQVDDEAKAQVETDAPLSWAIFHEVELDVDLNADGQYEHIALRNRQLRIHDADGVLLFETDQDWQVSDVLIADFDHNGAVEVLFLLWKHGNYGSIKPFWEKSSYQDASPTNKSNPNARAEVQVEGLTQHLFLYRLHDDKCLRPVWMSSQIGVRATCIELVGSYDQPRLRITSENGRITYWEWLYWGFALIEDSDSIVNVTSDNYSSENKSITLLVVGDNIAHTNIYTHAFNSVNHEYDFSPLYEHIKDHIDTYDLAAVCQETILVDNPARTSGYPTFATPQSMGDALAGSGFNLVLGATNHANDQGVQAIDETCSFWAREHSDVTLLGLHGNPDEAGQPVYIERNGIRLACFDYTYGLNGHNLSSGDEWRIDVLTDSGKRHLIQSVEDANVQADFTICFLHIGEEYVHEPTIEQTELVYELIDAGAGAVICSHSHVIGPWGSVTTQAGNKGMVFYGLGNFVSGQYEDIATIVGAAANLRLERIVNPDDGSITVRLVRSELIPLICHTDMQDGSVAAYYLEDYSDDLAAQHALNHFIDTDDDSDRLTASTFWKAFRGSANTAECQ